MDYVSIILLYRGTGYVYLWYADHGPGIGECSRQQDEESAGGTDKE